MINLLPPSLKQDYKYARRNTALLRIIASFGLGIAGLAVISAAGIVYLHGTASGYNGRAETLRQELKDQDEAGTEKKMNEISGNIKLAVQVLSQEVLFSELISQLAVITPSRASLSNINLSSDFSGSVTITAETANYDAATQLQINMTDPENKIFAGADIVSINCQSGSAAGKRYPCTAVYRAIFAKDNPFLFINGKESAR